MTLYGEEILEIIRVSSESSYRLLVLILNEMRVGIGSSLADDTVYINSSQVQTPQLLRDCFP